MSLPSMSIIGLKESSNKHFLPHYYTMAELYKRSRIVHVESKSVMYVRDALGSLDFWNLDSDFFFTEDMIGHQNLMGYGGNHFAYFSGFLKIYRIAHGLFEQDSVLKFDWTKNKAHVIDIYNNMLVSDVILISPVLEEIFDRILPEYFSAPLLDQLKSRYLVLPPPDLYKLEIKPKKKDWSKLVFLWNHRFTDSKGYKAFFGIIQKLQADHPELPIEILVLSLNTKEEVERLMPESLRPFLTYHPFIYDKEEYKKVVGRANITIGTSKIESFGISVFDAVSQGLAMVNLKCNQAFTTIVGPGTTFTEKEAPAKIYRLWSDEQYRKKLLKYNLRGLRSLPDRETYVQQFEQRLQTLFQERLDRTAGTSPKIQQVLKALDNGPLDKRGVYKAMGWKSTGSCTNTFWSDYYYGLRKHGVQTTFDGQRLLFYTGDKPKIQKRKLEVSKTAKGLF